MKQTDRKEVSSHIIMGCTGNKMQGDNSISLGVGNSAIEYRVTPRRGREADYRITHKETRV